MSVATAFKFAEAFPFCASNAPTYPSVSTFVGSLTLTQVMALFWNLENLTFTTTGSVAFTRADTTTGTTTANGSCILSPFALTGDWAVMGGRTLQNSSLNGPTHTAVNGETSLTPQSRVCTPYIPIRFNFLEVFPDDIDAFAGFEIQPDSNLWKVGGAFEFEFFPSNFAGIMFSDQAVAGFTHISDGTFDMGNSILFPWWAGYHLPVGWTLGAVSANLSATPSSYTYP